MDETHTSSPCTRGDLHLRPPTSPRRIRADLPLLRALISGGQTGVDQSALRAARALGLATGGYAPQGWRTLDGPNPTLGTDYGLVEAPSPGYPWRTAKNVLASDATIRLAETFTSPGEIRTLRAITKFKRPSLSICLLPLSRKGFALEDPRDASRALVAFLILHEVRILNIAGDSERTARGIGTLAEAFLIQALREGEPHGEVAR